MEGWGPLDLGTLLAESAEAAAAQLQFAPGETGNSSVHERRAVSVRFLRSEAAADEIRRATSQGSGITHRACYGRPARLAFRFEQQGQSGIPVSELLPRLGACIDDICILRSLHSDNPNHGPALYLMNNGTITPKRPSLGSWVLYGLGSENQNLPGYVVLCPGRPVRFAELWTTRVSAGRISRDVHQPFQARSAGNDPVSEERTLEPAQQRRQLDLLQTLNREHLRQRGTDDRWRPDQVAGIGISNANRSQPRRSI